MNVSEHQLMTFALFLCTSQMGLMAVLLATHRKPETIQHFERPLLSVIYGLGTLAVWLWTGKVSTALAFLLPVIAYLSILRTCASGFLVTWRIFMVNLVFGCILGILSIFYISGLMRPGSSYPWLVDLGVVVAICWALLNTISLGINATVQFVCLFRGRRTRPVQPLAADSCTELSFFPRVSIHVPCYAEPPALVIETLDALSRLDYPNFEVLLIDNNTTDPDLWRPLEVHCLKLGERFRFEHVERLDGAKGGALNYALRKTDPAAEIIAVLDSDFISEPDFLSRLVGFFVRPEIGFVQTPHDYRDQLEGTFRRCCYWEYRDKHVLVYPGTNEWDAALLTGTMCLIRRSALEEVGGWSETCLSEDSELSVRLGMAGYEGQFVATTFGRGLTPETFAAYQKQRFRWIAGTTQQLIQHWRAFLPRSMGNPAKMSRTKKVIGFFYRFLLFNDLFAYLLAPLGLAMAADSIAQNKPIILPAAFILLIVVEYTAHLAYSHIRSLVMDRTVGDAFRGLLADAALKHVRAMAVVKAFSNQRRLAWHRTSKFKAMPASLVALRSVLPQLLLGTLAMVVAAMLFPYAHIKTPDIVLLVTVGIFALGTTWLSSPALALMGELDLLKSRSLHGASDRESDPAPSSGLPLKTALSKTSLEA